MRSRMLMRVGRPLTSVRWTQHSRSFERKHRLICFAVLFPTILCVDFNNDVLLQMKILKLQKRPWKI